MAVLALNQTAVAFLAVLVVLAAVVLMAAQQALVTRQAHLPPKAQTVVAVAALGLIMAVEAVVAQRLLEKTAQAVLVALVAQERHLAFLEAASLMLVAAAVAFI